MRRLLAWVAFVVRGDGTGYRDRWQDRILRGHIRIGRATIYGANAMHWAVNVRWRGTYWCFHPTTRTFGGHWRWYFYISRNATPWAATFLLGPGVDRTDREALADRKRGVITLGSNP